MNSKGSISISINMIVVVVLAFVMLGLMLTLGQSIIDNASQTANQVSEQTRQDIVNKLTTSKEPLYFTQRNYEIGFNDNVVLTFGIKNTAPSQRPVKLLIDSIDPATGAPSTVSSTVGADYGEFQWDVGSQILRAGEGKPFDIIYNAPGATDTYQFKFTLECDISHPTLGVNCGGEKFIAEQSIFIQVR